MNLCWSINFFDGHACHLSFGQSQLWFQKFRGHVNSLMRFEQGPLELRNQKNSDLCFCLAKWPQNEMWKLPDINIFKRAKVFKVDSFGRRKDASLKYKSKSILLSHASNFTHNIILNMLPFQLDSFKM